MNENVQAGDIGSIYTKGYGLTHSYNLLNPYEIFEKQNPYIEHLPEISETVQKFGPNTNLQSGCKAQTSAGCGWGIVNYRCDPSKIQDLKDEVTVKGKEVRSRFSYLANALDQAFKTGSSAAIDDAFNRYLDFQFSSMKTADHIEQAVSIEGMDRLLLVIGAHLDQFKAMPNADLSRFSLLDEKLEGIESEGHLPQNFDDFPNGGLLQTR